ncbi:outer membrane protein [Legionella spiritensis]|uniref:Opacity protein-like surface antigen n=1 Tax=Legionella spiritensis TaxID=452 RepID=A0A0W0YYU8_LEGSP|nr:outer membrane beta-barrel protein [Legionella spiritensis]KTD62044.1 opacity protein-like surface antigen [Legionella spiritensis]SNV34529.1 opacity protein-like surface antigen [Legionella spiritensis]
MKIAFISATLLSSSVAFSATPIDGWYGSVFGGYTYLSDNISETRNGLFRNEASYTSGSYNAGGRIGYKSTPLRYEGELTYLQGNLTKFDINFIRQSGITGQTQAALAMANVYYDFPDIVPAISPFLGAGLGYAWIDASFGSTGPSVGATYYKASNSVFAYQATAGITYNFAENYAVNLAYRHIGTDRVSDLNKVFQADLASVGVIYRFDKANYK